jgi:hypothetical protein
MYDEFGDWIPDENNGDYSYGGGDYNYDYSGGNDSADTGFDYSGVNDLGNGLWEYNGTIYDSTGQVTDSSGAPIQEVTDTPAQTADEEDYSGWSSVGNLWRSPDGTMYDSTGQVVDSSGNPIQAAATEAPAETVSANENDNGGTSTGIDALANADGSVQSTNADGLSVVSGGGTRGIDALAGTGASAGDGSDGPVKPNGIADIDVALWQV